VVVDDVFADEMDLLDVAGAEKFVEAARLAVCLRLAGIEVGLE
jgi:hypothetical protein